MKKLELDKSWPKSWQYSHPYDMLEIWNDSSHLGYSYSYSSRRKKTIELITEVLPKGSKILDIAGAQGNFSLSLSEYGYDVTWNDLREDLVGYVQKKYEFGNLTFKPGNIFDFGIKHEFDCVLITEIIEHMAHPDEFLIKVASLVKPGGYIVMSTPNGAYFRNKLPKFSECQDPSIFESRQFGPNADDHIFLLWPDEIEVIADKANLIMDLFHVHSNPLTCGHIKLERLLKFIPKKIVYFIESLSQALPNFVKVKICANSLARFKVPE
jgi:2-polyprenyl-3-methyl-5-hydroxy-6-metoxy-1,4-benzoquinol methylase